MIAGRQIAERAAGKPHQLIGLAVAAWIEVREHLERELSGGDLGDRIRIFQARRQLHLRLVTDAEFARFCEDAQVAVATFRHRPALNRRLGYHLQPFFLTVQRQPRGFEVEDERSG